MWAKIKRGVVVEIRDQRPRWKDGEGYSVSDDFLRENGWYFVLDHGPSRQTSLFHESTLNEENHWIVDGGYVIKTYTVRERSVSEIQQILIKAADNRKTDKINSGVEVMINGVEYLFDSSDKSAQRLKDARDLNKKKIWETKDDRSVEISGEHFNLILEAIEDKRESAYQQYLDIKKRVKSTYDSEKFEQLMVEIGEQDYVGKALIG